MWQSKERFNVETKRSLTVPRRNQLGNYATIIGVPAVRHRNFGIVDQAGTAPDAPHLGKSRTTRVCGVHSGGLPSANT